HRTRHAIVRNFVTYNRTERELRPQLPLYAGALTAGMMSSLWLPGRRSAWQEGGHSELSQVGYGREINVVSEFALDIVHYVGMKKHEVACGESYISNFRRQEYCRF